MYDFSGYSGSTTWDSIGEFADASYAPRVQRPSKRRAEASALVGVAITAAVTKNEEERRTIADILSRLAVERYISKTSMHTAQCFIEALPQGKHLPKISPDGEGGVLFAWAVAGHGRTLITLSDWMAYAVADAGTPAARYLSDTPFEGVIADELLAVIPA